ncbi:hypothetical protein WR25_18819 [Diploscapter pachys]|uniref:Uncharacterized protein n=1 Tax=Diploscapter pachys TaxID=2018661 RepID=A0A2A2KIZ9_9BILA|nr:hypothetical protein WR25_18819 [Diploscapter pachys]
MLGIPCVRFELNWFLRSNDASSPSISVARISPGARSCTVSSTSAMIPLVIAALLSARKCNVPSSRRRIRHRFKRAAEVDQQPIAIVGVQKVIFVAKVGEAGHAKRGTGGGGAGQPVASQRACAVHANRHRSGCETSLGAPRLRPSSRHPGRVPGVHRATRERFVACDTADLGSRPA